MKVAVLKGGRSLERGVSLRSAARAEDALESLGHEVLALDIGSDLVTKLRDERPDAAFVALHGPGGEDGTVQELLEILGIPYTGPGVAACALCMDKVAAKHELRSAGLATPDWVAFNATAFRELGAADTLEEIEEKMGFPLVVKPASQGSSLGVKFASAQEEVPGALVAAFSYDDRVLLERYVEGRELAVGILGSDPLPIVEAIPRGSAKFDFEARYEIGRTDYACPAELAEGEADEVTDLAARAYETLGCSGFARVDLMLGAGGPQVLEVNAIPGLTDTSLFPMAAEAAGIGFEELVERLGLESSAKPVGQLLVLEIFGRDVVEELLELVDDLLGVLGGLAVLELDRGLLDHVVGREDRGRCPHRERERVGGAGVDLELGAVHGDRDRRVEGVVTEFGDRDLLALRVHGLDHLRKQVVGHRARGRGALELHQDCGGLGMADPDR